MNYIPVWGNVKACKEEDEEEEDGTKPTQTEQNQTEPVSFSDFIVFK